MLAKGQARSALARIAGFTTKTSVADGMTHPKGPFLAGYPLEVLGVEHEDTRRQAAEAFSLPIGNLPEQCPWTLEQVVDAEFWPRHRTRP